jgi:hypothetical protein
MNAPGSAGGRVTLGENGEETPGSAGGFYFRWVT